MSRQLFVRIGIITVAVVLLLGAGLTIYAYRQAVDNQTANAPLATPQFPAGNNANQPGNNANQPGNNANQPGNNPIQPGNNGGGQIPVMIVEIIPGSPAMAAGLQPGDNILSADGQPINPWRMLELLRQKQPGDTLTLGVRRAAQELNLTVTLGDDANAPGRAYLGATILPPPPPQAP